MSLSSSVRSFFRSFVTFFCLLVFLEFVVHLDSRCLKSVSKKFQGCFKEVSRVSQESFKGVSRKFQECFKEVSRKFQG